MKKIFLFFAGFLITVSTYGQEQFFRFGPKIGVSSSNINVKDINSTAYRFESGEARLGFHVGAFARVSVANFYIQPEALFTSAGGRVRINEIGQDDVVRNYRLNKFDVPVMIGTKFGNFFRFQLGPVFSMLLSDDAKQNVTGSYNEIKQGWRDASVGYQVGIGLDAGQFILDLKYEGSLSKMGDNINIDGVQFDTDLRNNQFILSLGFSLF